MRKCNSAQNGIIYPSTKILTLRYQANGLKTNKLSHSHSTMIVKNAVRAIERCQISSEKFLTLGANYRFSLNFSDNFKHTLIQYMEEF